MIKTGLSSELTATDQKLQKSPSRCLNVFMILSDILGYCQKQQAQELTAKIFELMWHQGRTQDFISGG